MLLPACLTLLSIAPSVGSWRSCFKISFNLPNTKKIKWAFDRESQYSMSCSFCHLNSIVSSPADNLIGLDLLYSPLLIPLTVWLNLSHNILLVRVSWVWLLFSGDSTAIARSHFPVTFIAHPEDGTMYIHLRWTKHRALKIFAFDLQVCWLERISAICDYSIGHIFSSNNLGIPPAPLDIPWTS